MDAHVGGFTETCIYPTRMASFVYPFGHYFAMSKFAIQRPLIRNTRVEAVLRYWRLCESCIVRLDREPILGIRESRHLLRAKSELYPDTHAQHERVS